MDCTLPLMRDRNARSIQQHLLRGALVCAVLLIAGYLIFVGTSWGHRIDEGAYFGREAVGEKVTGVDLDILDLVTKAALLAAAVVLLAIAALRRCVLVGVLAAAGFGCAVTGAEILKAVLPWRALLAADATLEPGLQADTYPSGHATVGTSFALSLVLISSARWRPWLAVAGGCVSAVFATGVLFAGWHRPSDSLGALAWSGLCMTGAAALAVQLRGRPRTAVAHPRRAVLGSAVMAALLAAATWVRAAPAAPQYPHADLPFLAFSALIIAAAFYLAAWYGWQLRGVDWPAAGQRD